MDENSLLAKLRVKILACLLKARETPTLWPVGALVVLLASPGLVIAQGASTPNDPFVLLLTGIYQPVVKARSSLVRG